MKKILLGILIISVNLFSYEYFPVQTIGAGIKLNDGIYKGQNIIYQPVLLNNLNYYGFYNQGMKFGYKFLKDDNYFLGVYFEPQIGFKVKKGNIPEYKDFEKNYMNAFGIHTSFTLTDNLIFDGYYAWGDKKGNIGEINIFSPITFNYDYIFSPYITSNYYSKEYTNHYFSTNNHLNQSFSIGVGSSFEYFLTEAFTLISFLEYKRYISGLNDSVLIDSPNLFIGGIGIKYSFY